MPSLKNPMLKVDRASEHLDTLRQELAAFCASEPVRLSREEHVQKGLYTIRFDLKEPSSRTALIVGDFAYCLRSALDQLAWQLALLNTNERPTAKTCFPIYGKANSKLFTDCVRGIPEKAVAIIHALQPYQHGEAYKGNLLWKLHKLCIIDKHQRITVHSHATQVGFPSFPRTFAGALQFNPEAQTLTVPLSLKEHLQNHPVAGIEVLFGDTDIDFAVTVQELEQTLDLISRDILPRFESFLRP